MYITYPLTHLSISSHRSADNSFERARTPSNSEEGISRGHHKSLPPFHKAPRNDIFPRRNQSSKTTYSYPPLSSKSPPARYPETLGTLLEIRASPGRGLGVFALVDIPSGTLLHAETPLATVSLYAPLTNLTDALSLLTVSQADAYYPLSPYSRHKTRSLHVKILDRNAFEIAKGERSGISQTGSRINHSCVPNSEFEWVAKVGRMVFWNRWPSMQGEEVTVNYVHKREDLKKFASLGVCVVDVWRSVPKERLKRG